MPPNVGVNRPACTSGHQNRGRAAELAGQRSSADGLGVHFGRGTGGGRHQSARDRGGHSEQVNEQGNTADNGHAPASDSLNACSPLVQDSGRMVDQVVITTPRDPYPDDGRQDLLRLNKELPGDLMGARQLITRRPRPVGTSSGCYLIVNASRVERPLVSVTASLNVSGSTLCLTLATKALDSTMNPGGI